MDIPDKQPRKSHKQPAPHGSDEQRTANPALSRVRIFGEHALGGRKRYAILVHKFRNHKKDFEDEVIGMCAGLWNLALSDGGTSLLRKDRLRIGFHSSSRLQPQKIDNALQGIWRIYCGGLTRNDKKSGGNAGCDSTGTIVYRVFQYL